MNRVWLQRGEMSRKRGLSRPGQRMVLSRDGWPRILPCLKIEVSRLWASEAHILGSCLIETTWLPSNIAIQHLDLCLTWNDNMELGSGSARVCCSADGMTQSYNLKFAGRYVSSQAWWEHACRMVYTYRGWTSILFSAHLGVRWLAHRICLEQRLHPHRGTLLPFPLRALLLLYWCFSYAPQSSSPPILAFQHPPLPSSQATS